MDDMTSTPAPENDVHADTPDMLITAAGGAPASDLPVPKPTPTNPNTPETELVDAAVTAATPLIKEAAVSLRDKLVAEGHALIDRHLGAAKRIADLQPAVRPLLPLISACLHDLFAHMTSEQSAAPVATPSSARTPSSGQVDVAATAAIVDPAPEVKAK